MKTLPIALVALAVSACSPPDAGRDTQAYRPPPGSNIMLRAPLSAAPELEVIIADVFIPPNQAVPAHYHPGEEFLLVLEGSALHIEDGKPDRVISAGEAYVIPPFAKHAPRGGPEGGRAVVCRIHVRDQPERFPVDPSEINPDG